MKNHLSKIVMALLIVMTLLLLNIPETAQIYFYTVKDGNLYTYIGTYYNEEQKQIVMDTINIMVQTTEAV